MTRKNKNIVEFPDMKKIEMQASEWIVGFTDREPTDEQLTAFHEWRSRSEHHNEAYKRLAALWGELDIVEELNDYATSDNTASLLAKETKKRWGRRQFLGYAAAVAAIAIGFSVTKFDLGTPEVVYAGIYETKVGEQKKAELPDGSFIRLNTNSFLDVAYNKSERTVRLIRGEAYFDVASDKNKPFVVYAGKNVVRAVGTAFTVRLQDEKINVVVTEGRVALSPRRDSSEFADKPTMEMTVGQSAVFKGKVESIHHLDAEVLNRKLAWRQGQLKFSGEPLSDVVADISRYTDVKIEITDDSLRNLPIAGYFKVGEVEAMLEALEIMRNVHVERKSPKFVQISKAPQS